ncbi:MAG TPA: hypothetical protein VND45_13185 [Thermoanaerobaculia bacterium]|jgi:hypothetical protein|nr:hypothetical protein [Thermoanaerobaculia bacterium]
MMRFTIEERHLTDTDGRPISAAAPDSVAFRSVEADDIDDAIRLYVRDDAAEVIGSVLKFPGFQAVATVRKATGVYTLQLTPASQQFKL